MSATTAAAAKSPEKPFQTLMQDREVELVRLNISLEEFIRHVTVRFDNDYAHRWRVTGDRFLYHWLYDVYRNDLTMLSEAQAVKIAYEHLQAIQARKGQVNTNSVYVQDRESVFLSEQRKLEYARVEIVQDRFDGKWRFSTSYTINNGGSSYAPALEYEQFATRNEAIFAGAAELLENITRGWEYRDKPAAYQPTVNRIKESVEQIRDNIRQPSLFGF